MPGHEGSRASAPRLAAALPTNCSLGGDLLTVSCAYSYTGMPQTFTMPVGAQPDVELTVDGGGAATSYQAYGSSAGGGESRGTVALTAGTTLTLVVGQQGQAGPRPGGSNPAAGAASTYGGGGRGGSASSEISGANGGDSGAGGSFVLQGTTALLIAGGAGGTGAYGCTGGTGGGAGDAAPPGPAAQSVSLPTNCTNPGASASGAQPGTSTVGGSGSVSADGASGLGGAGQDSPYHQASRSAVCGGAGGGGGYAGGAGGGGTLDYTRFYCGGGGGGSGYADSSVRSVSGQAGAHAGDGRIVLTYALVAVAPVVTQQPSDQTVNEGGRGTFQASASGVPSPAVQWQRSTDGGSTFTNVTGATTGTYQTPDTTPGDDGEQFRAVFSNSGGSVTTSPATMTVQTAPAFTTPAGALPGGTVGQPYSTTIKDTGKPVPTVSVQSGELPPGLELSGDPVLSGTPTISGTFRFTLRASNAAGSADRTFTVTIAPAAGPTPTPPVKPTPSPSPLPRTGIDAAWPFGLGLLLVGGGLLIRLVGRRRFEV